MILVCGEALVDLFLAQPEGAGIPARIVAGGSPFNVAIGLARLGQPSAFLGGLSKDHFGQYLSELLSREGVSLDHIHRSSRLTTISVVSTDAFGSPAYSFHGEGAADRMLESKDLPANLPDSVTALTFGSYTLCVEPVGTAYLALAQREKGKRVISLDPNVRPSIVGDMLAWRTRFDAFLACATIVKASAEDIEIAYGSGTRIGDIARSWLAAGPALVVVTLGEQGAVAFFQGGEVSVSGRKVVVADTVGAGDTFHAALLARLATSGFLEMSRIATVPRNIIVDALGYAIAASSITCSRVGADLPRAVDVSHVLSGVA